PPNETKKPPKKPPHPPTRGTNNCKIRERSHDDVSSQKRLSFSHPPAQGNCKITPDLTRSWPSPYQEMYINSTKRQLKVGQDQKKKINIDNQMKQGFRVDGRETSTSKQIPNKYQTIPPPHPVSQTGTKSDCKITKKSPCPPTHPIHMCKITPDLTRSWPSPYQEMYINSTKRQLKVGQDQKKKINIDNQMKQGFRVDGRETSTSKQIPNKYQTIPPPHPVSQTGTKSDCKITKKSPCPPTHPIHMCKITPDLTRSWPSPYQEMYINSTKRQLKVGQDQKKKINIDNQMKQGFRVDGRETSTSKQIPNKYQTIPPPHPVSQTGTKSDCKITKKSPCPPTHPIHMCKITPDLTRSWPSPYQEMYINSTKRQLKVGQDQKKKINIDNQMKQGFRVDGRETSTSKQIPNKYQTIPPPHPVSQTGTKSDCKITKKSPCPPTHPIHMVCLLR
ncbi:hypothetical protein EV363DRAFT_1200616, partial [Boletus edulis]